MIQIGSSHADPAKTCLFVRNRIRNTAFHESVVLLQKQLFYGTSPLDENKGLICAVYRLPHMDFGLEVHNII